VRPYCAYRQVPLDVKHCARTCGRYRGVVGQAVTETLVNQFSYLAFHCCLVQGMKLFYVVEQISLLLLPTKSTCDRKLGDTAE
jgi:hypothetical protein